MTRRRSTSRPPAGTTPPAVDEGAPAGQEETESQSAPRTPVKRYRVTPAADDTRPRAGGHVLTERGWVPETRQEK